MVEKSEKTGKGKSGWILFVAIMLVLLGALVAWYAHTAGGTVDIREINFMGTNGILMSGYLYIPEGVTAENPAPGVLAVHGYINSRETQSGFSIEFARRGYVVLALDESGHGYSDPPAFANGFGGPDGLSYLRSLDIVDPDNIGLEGHSMGGWASAIAAGVFPDDYKSIVLEGSSTGTFGAPDGTPEWPRNLGLVFSEWDEFSALMWGAEIPKDIVHTDKLKALFNTTESVEVGKLYGSIEEGTARKLYMPRVTHPGDHLSTQAIGDAVEWMQLTLEGGNDLAPSNQVWYWKEIGTLLAFIGLVLFMLALGSVLLKRGYFATLMESMPPSRAVTGIGWWISALLATAIPAVTFFWLQNRGNTWFPAGSFWPQTITTGIMTWAFGNGVISLVLFLLWHFLLNRRNGATAENYGLTWNGRIAWGRLGKSFLLALAVAFSAYLVLAVADFFFKIDFRFWIVALKLLSPLQFRIFLAYLLPFAAFFLIFSTTLNGQLRRTKANGSDLSMGWAVVINALIATAGLIVGLLVQYIPLLAGGTLAIADEPLLTIVAIQFVPILAIVAIISTFFYRKTGHVYVGAFLNALFVTWYIVAGQAIQFAL